MTDAQSCTCGSQRADSARYGHPHLLWCAARVTPPDDLRALAELAQAAKGLKTIIRPWVDRAAGLPPKVTFAEWDAAAQRLEDAITQADRVLTDAHQTTCEGGGTVRWCPRCGTCTCPSQDGNPDRWVEDPYCPIHGDRSAHAEPVRALAAAQQTPQERRTFTHAEVVALKLTRAELIDLIIGLQDTYSGRVESLGKVRGSLPDNEEGRNGSDQRHASGFKAPHEPSPVAHETPAPRPAEDKDTPGYGNAMCVCGHTSSRHNCDHETSDDSCQRCGCEGFAVDRNAFPPPAPRPEDTTP